MINLRFEFQNPWTRDIFKNLGSKHWKFGNNKILEIQHTFYDGMIIDFDFSWKRKCDHAGVFLNLGVLGYGIHFSVYDNRHWNYELNDWIKND